MSEEKKTTKKKVNTTDLILNKLNQIEKNVVTLTFDFHDFKEKYHTEDQPIVNFFAPIPKFIWKHKATFTGILVGIGLVFQFTHTNPIDVANNAWDKVRKLTMIRGVEARLVVIEDQLKKNTQILNQLSNK